MNQTLKFVQVTKKIEKWTKKITTCNTLIHTLTLNKQTHNKHTQNCKTHSCENLAHRIEPQATTLLQPLGEPIHSTRQRSSTELSNQTIETAIGLKGKQKRILKWEYSSNQNIFTATCKMIPKMVRIKKKKKTSAHSVKFFTPDNLEKRTILKHELNERSGK